MMRRVVKGAGSNGIVYMPCSIGPVLVLFRSIIICSGLLMEHCFYVVDRTAIYCHVFCSCHTKTHNLRREREDLSFIYPEERRTNIFDRRVVSSSGQYLLQYKTPTGLSQTFFQSVSGSVKFSDFYRIFNHY